MPRMRLLPSEEIPTFSASLPAGRGDARILPLQQLQDRRRRHRRTRNPDNRPMSPLKRVQAYHSELDILPERDIPNSLRESIERQLILFSNDNGIVTQHRGPCEAWQRALPDLHQLTNNRSFTRNRCFTDSCPILFRTLKSPSRSRGRSP